MKILFGATLAGLVLGVAHAQAEQPVVAIDAQYESVFSLYQGMGSTATQPWSQSNATVQARGGWRAYAMEAARAAKEATKEQGAVSAHHQHHGGKP